MLTKDKITEIFCIADDFCKNFAIEMANHPKLTTAANGKRHRNRACEMSQSQIITILILYHLSSSDNFKAFYLHYIGVHLKQEFPKSLSYSRFIQIQHRVFIPMMFFLNTVCFGNCTGITFIDSTKIAICHNKRKSIETKCFKTLPSAEKVVWDTFTVSNCTWFVTTKENCYLSV